MKNRLFLILGAPLVIILTALLSRNMFFYYLTESQYDKIMCYYIARKVAGDSNDFNEKVNRIRDFVHENVHPVGGYYCRPDTLAIEKLLSGIGWCDQQARVFMQLAHNTGITSRLLFLRLDSGSSPHSAAEVLTPDKRWALVDVGYKLDLVKKNGDLATQADIKNDPAILYGNKKVQLRSRFKERWADKGYLAIYYNDPIHIVTKKAMKFDYLRSVPISWLRPIITFIQDGFFDKIGSGIIDKYELEWLRARGYYLLDYYEKSEALYKEIVESSTNLQLVRKAEYYYSALLKDQKKYEEAYRYITGIINNDKDNGNPYLVYLYGVRAFVLERLGRAQEAEQDLLKIGYSLEI